MISVQRNANKVAEWEQVDVERVQRDAELPQRDSQELRNEVQQDGVGRLEERLVIGSEARQREEDSQQARKEVARDAWERVAEAERVRKAADEARQAAEERLLHGIPPDLQPTTEQIHRFRELHGCGKYALNIALVGESGVGKSALLNALRGLWPDDPGAAAVGVNETTAIVRGYNDPRHPQVQWFDVPGANTPNISGWLYFMNQNLYIFEVLVILFSDRFTQTVGTLLSNAHRCGIRTFLVRTKADQLVQNVKKERRSRLLTDAQARQIIVDNTRDMVIKNLTRLNLPLQPVFVVSASGMREWVMEGDTTNMIDEQLLYQTLSPESAAVSSLLVAV